MANRPPELSNLRITLAASAVTVTVVAWGVLVFAAINFGRTARAGTNNGWLYLVLTTLGAVACMFAAIVMAAHLQSLMRIAQRSSTRPLAQPLNELPPLPGFDEPEHWDQPDDGPGGRTHHGTGSGTDVRRERSAERGDVPRQRDLPTRRDAAGQARRALKTACRHRWALPTVVPC